MQTARQIKEACGVPFIFRAGAWKPRTSPNSFQGVGEEALEWLQEVKECLNLEIATEVATPEHVEAALRAGIDYLWIGARTSANPIAVENITQAFSSKKEEKLKGVLIKNPVNEDAGLWIGNIERLERSGVPVMAVHRGCGHQPCWAMAHEVRLTRPDIPMLLDPSHMSGNAAKVPELLAKTEELGLDGAMIEVHYQPEEALSDAKQQIKPQLLKNILSTGTTFSRGFHEVLTRSADTELNWLRAEIDELDEQLWHTIAARMDVSKRIGEWKKTHGVAPLQPKRFRQISEQVALFAQANGLSADFAQEVLRLIHEESLKQQE